MQAIANHQTTDILTRRNAKHNSEENQSLELAAHDTSSVVTTDFSGMTSSENSTTRNDTVYDQIMTGVLGTRSDIDVLYGIQSTEDHARHDLDKNLTMAIQSLCSSPTLPSEVSDNIHESSKSVSFDESQQMDC